MNPEKNKSPGIVSLSWGQMVIDGLGAGKDYKLWPGGGREWDWRETGTHHRPGIQPADVEELLDRGTRIVILSRGKLLMLHTCRETLELLETRGITIHIAETGKACKIYNDLAARGEAVGGLFHSTC